MKKQNKEDKPQGRFRVPKDETRYSGLLILIVLILFFYFVTRKARAEEGEGDGYYGILNANPALIESISNDSGTLTGDLYTKYLNTFAKTTYIPFDVGIGDQACGC